ncbi:hypothetical protein Cni_G13591 [Canna indica]|uniref:Uncharacterized protein n=1 Tax=Canna indica TaxID=4628 RepID=A0AAQ3KA58_9LILI|nr:hypothetical protein Cni_G13591 [Canna indica]
MVSLQVSVFPPISTSFLCNLCCRGYGFELRFLRKPANCSLRRRKVGAFRRDGCFIECSRQRFPFSDGYLKDLILVREGSRRSMLVVRANQGFDFNGGGGGWDKNTTSRVLGNLALAIGLTYLTMTGQLGWILDAIVSIWLLAVLLPIVGLGAFFWFAGRDMVQSNCPNCGNEFQILKSAMKDGPQLCPFCSQPFSVKGDMFVREPSRFSSERSTTFGQAFSGFSPRVDKGKASSTAVVDIEAEVKDID